MIWRALEVVLRLRSPLHIGWGKLGSLQRTRPYVTGRVLWGALTMRLTRDTAEVRGVPANDSAPYQEVGKAIHRELAFTYFYAALRAGAEYRVPWPWDNERTFRRRFLGSYQGTALSCPQQTSAEGMLHETEFISPYTLDRGEPVFLKGYVFQKEGCTLDWQSALKRLQMGGERAYGWGDVGLVDVLHVADGLLFGDKALFKGDADIPVIHLPVGGYLLAHALTADLPAAGDVEPLAGREWRSDNPRHRYVGQHVAFDGIGFAPGSKVSQAVDFAVKGFGIWVRSPLEPAT